MSDDPFVLPAIVRAKARELGRPGTVWLDQLPSLVRTLEQRWSFTLGEQLSGGTSAFVAEVRCAGGPAVLKLAVPDPATAAEIRTLEAADGRGYVRVLRSEPDLHAVLLERLGPSLSRSVLLPEAQLGIICDLLPLAWRVPRPDGAEAKPYDKASALGDMVSDLWLRVGPDYPDVVLARALECAGRRSAAFDPDACVVVHGDAAAANVLSVLRPRPGAVGGFVLVDPSGFVGDPVYDLGVAVRDWCPELLAGDPATVARSYSRLMADRSGQDEAAIWEWGFLERVSTGLYVWSLGAEDAARPFLTTARALCREPATRH